MMTRRRSSARIAAYLALALVALLTVWNGIGHWLLRSSPAAAPAMLGGEEIRQVRLAEISLAQVETQPANAKRLLADARVHARDALGRTPLVPGGFGALTYAEALGGNQKQLAKLIAVQPDIGWRDQLALIGKLIQQAQFGDRRGVGQTIDVFLRGTRRPEQRVFPFLVRLATDPQFNTELVGLLEARPHWRSRFLHHLGGEAAFAPVAANIFDGLLARSDKLTASETENFFWVNRYTLPARDQYRRWQAIFAPSAANSGIRDGDFARLTGVPPFTWSIRQDGGAFIRLDAAEGGRHVLAATIDGTDDTPVTGQQMLLPAGGWTVNLVARTETNSGAPQAVQLGVTCLPSRTKIAQKDFNIGKDNAPIAFAFAVPASGCDAQEFEITAKRSAENYPYNLFLQSVSAKKSS